MNLNLKSAFAHIKFIRRKPLVLLRIANGFFRRIVLRRNVLRTIDLAVTYDCHYQCAYCSAFLLKKHRPVLTTEQIKNIWEQALKLGVMHINLTGGEPLMRNIDELCQIIRNLQPHKVLVSLVTNSVLTTKEKLAKLKEAGLDTLQLSIESLDPRKNDKLRGVKGITAKTLETFQWAKDLGLTICLSSVMCHDNRQDLEGLLNFAEKEDAFLLLNTASSVGRWQNRQDKKMVEEDIASFDNFMKNRRVRSDTSFNFTGKRGCPGGTERIHITGYGEVMTCPLVQVSYGNALEEPLKDIFGRMNSLPFLKKYSRLCKQSFDRDYYETICRPAEQINNPPLSIFQHPNVNIKKDLNNQPMERDSFFDKCLRWLRYQKVIKHIPEDSVVCDIGCGYGAGFLKKISCFIKQGVGLDKEVNDFKNANLEFKKIKVFKDIPVGDEACDIVTMIAVIEHLEHPQKILNEAFRILKERGKLILTTPTPLAKPILEFLSFKLGLVDKNEIGGHKNYFWTKDIKKMLLKSGFKEEGIKNCFFECYLNNLIIAQK